MLYLPHQPVFRPLGWQFWNRYFHHWYLDSIKREVFSLKMEIIDDTFDVTIGQNLRRLRAEKGFTLDQLSEVSTVSRAMISRIERGEASPSALLLSKLCAALGTSLSAFFSDADKPVDPLLRRVDQPVWRDPETGYTRRVISPQATGSAVDIVQIRFPAGARIAYPPKHGASELRQHLWVLHGVLDVIFDDETSFELHKGDCLFMPVAEPHIFSNPGMTDVIYAVVIEHAYRK